MTVFSHSQLPSPKQPHSEVREGLVRAPRGHKVLLHHGTAGIESHDYSEEHPETTWRLSEKQLCPCPEHSSPKVEPWAGL